MALATQCPHCYTCFRVANDQLKLHAGLVRCGVCQHTFNGIEHLLAPGEAPKVAPQTTPAPDTDSNGEAHAETTLVNHNEPAPEPGITQEAVALEHDEFQQIDTTSATAMSAAETTQNVANADQDSLDFELDFTTGFTDDESNKVTEAPQAEPATKQQETATEDKIEPSDHNPYSIDIDLDAWAIVGSDKSDSITEHAQHEERIEPAIDNEETQDQQVSYSIADEETDFDAEPAHTIDASLSVVENFDNQAPGETGHDVTSDDESTAEIENEADTQAEAETDAEEELPGFVVQAEKQKKYGRIKRILLWSLTPILLLTAFGQATYLWRNELAAQLPQSKPWLVQACAALNTLSHCRISLPMQIEFISIESNELQRLSEQRKLFSLNLQLQNHSSTVQAWPSIELTLDDDQNKAVVKRYFVPNDYLPIKTDPTTVSRGFAANGEQNIKLFFELDGIDAAGYHVNTYYP